MLVLLQLLVAAAPPTSPPIPLRSEPPAFTARIGLGRASRGDPRIAEVQAAASSCADASGSVDSGAARSRMAALLPRLTAELRFDDRSYRVTGLQGTGEVDYARQAPGWLAGVQATWELAALVSAPAERVDAKGMLDRARRREEAVRKATTLYFERRRLRLTLELDPPASPLEHAGSELEVERLAAELDAMTCGVFTGGER